ncbi:MAG: cadmium-translocating P-type ATPase [Solobacterium sp.]|nr:cadmium-translocating P-type ATPase [Solobacterium sp.]
MTNKQRQTLYRILATAILLVVLVILERSTNWNPFVFRILFLVPYLLIGHDILHKAWKGILNKQVFDENFLMSIATIGAMLLGETVEGVAVMWFYQIGELFQSIAVGKSRKNIAALMDIRPDYANRLFEDGHFESVDPDEIEIGTLILIQPGEKIPIDGIVVEGSSTIDTAALTGEGKPQYATVGDTVISGCVNQDGLLKVKTTKQFEDSTVAKVLDLVENSSMKKAKAENFITKFARYYTPIVCYSALALAIIPPLVSLLLKTDPKWSQWIIRALTFLVISCPCALVVSIPLSFFGGIGGASKKGILVKGSNYLEALADAKTLVLDKTGTLTKGVFKVTEIQPTKNHTKEEVLEVAAIAESYSNHPVAKSLKEAYGKELQRELVEEEKEIAGQGIQATINGKEVLVGNEKLMEANQIAYQKENHVGTIVYVARDKEYLGSIFINDVIKENAKDALVEIQHAGIQKTIMLSGDNESIAKDVATKVGIHEYHAGLLPADKVEHMERILSEKEKNEIVCFVGDGINDAPVLSRADVGIAMGALGSDAAIEAADIVLMDDDLGKIPMAIRIAKKCLRIVKENVVFAIGVKVACLILSAFGIANMWWAIFADVGVMVLAVLNATRTMINLQ